VLRQRIRIRGYRELTRTSAGRESTMYPVRIGFDEALNRIAALRQNHHDAEALVTSVFTLEKLMRRSLKLAILSRGFTSTQAETLINRKGFKELTISWPIFEKHHRGLSTVIGNRLWQHIRKAVKMRNDLVHGNRVYPLDDCRSYAEHVVSSLRYLHSRMLEDLRRDPWSKLPVRRKPQLPWFSDFSTKAAAGRYSAAAKRVETTTRS
jgi:hypothetical protein